MTKNEAIAVLIAYAERRDGIVHINSGLCPDILEGHDSRDPECIVCQALMVFDKEAAE